MPEVWLAGLIFISIFTIFWGIIEIAIKWLILQNILVWKNVWRSLASSVFMQLLQIPGAVMALVISFQILQGNAPGGDDTKELVIFLISFIVFRLITDVTIGGLFLTLVKKSSERAWRASLIANSLGAFFLGAFCVILFSINVSNIISSGGK